MCIHIYIYIYTYKCSCVYIYIYIYTHMFMCMPLLQALVDAKGFCPEALVCMLAF